MTEEQYKEVWVTKDCPLSEDGCHHADIVNFTLKCACGKEPNLEALAT